MKQYQSGYLLDRFNDLFEKKTLRASSFKELTKWCSFFQLKSKSGFEQGEVEYPATIAVLINLIQRGLPTKLNKYALDRLIEKCSILSFNESNERSIVVEFNQLTDELKELVFKAMHLVDPRIDKSTLKQSYRNSWEKLDSKFEENFLYQDLPNSIGKYGGAIIQLVAIQRTITSIINDYIDLQKVASRVKNNFVDQRTDFSIEFPYQQPSKPRGIVIEIDGSQHMLPEQQFLDTERDKVVASSGWNNTLRIKTSEFGSLQFDQKIKGILIPAINNEYLKHCISNFVKPFWESKLSNEIFQLCLVPFGVARIQRTILELIAHGKLELKKSHWKIAVLERDVPCAQLAIDDLFILVDAINALLKETLHLPKIELSVFATNEFINSKFKFSNNRPIESFDSDEFYDLVLDIGVLDKSIDEFGFTGNATEFVKIRSVHYLDSQRITAATDLIKYKPFCKEKDNTGNWIIEDDIAKDGLDYLLQSIFRKKAFLEGQLPIMHNALQCKSVIGLLPTGGGKSLTYQISALLQPGICLVIDPIRSLMKDQVDGLLRNDVDSCVYINSTLEGEDKRKAMRRMAEGEAQFVFVSPERLQMEEFRTLLSDMFNDGIYFSYCVIDEAHCVSEWGHDFRTAYLRLGENAIKFCKTKNLKYLPLFGLTATASYDVLADVQRELSGNNESRRLAEDAIIRSEYSKRDELQYIIEEVTFPTGTMRNIWDVKKALASKKQERVLRLLNEIPITIQEFNRDPHLVYSKDDYQSKNISQQHTYKSIQIENFAPGHFFKEGKNAALIFCPHTRGPYGVTDKFKTSNNGMPVVRQGYFDLLSQVGGIRAGYFMGSGNDSDSGVRVIQEESFDNQDKFINNELNLMIATKAFGMGIDKENIRFTIHINYPGSIESFVQEAGRAGRDRKIALSYILFNDQSVPVQDEEDPIDHDLDINMYFHKNSFKGIAKEIAVLNELLTEIYFPDRTFEFENLINNELEVNVKCNYWEGGVHKRLYVNFNFTEPLGYIDLRDLNGIIDKSVNPNLSSRIFTLIRNYINGQNLNEPIHLWIQRSDKQVGIEEILKSKRDGDTFSITVGFYNNAKERVKTITQWLHTVIHGNFTEAVVHRMRENCSDAEAFIEDVCDAYKRFTNGRELNFEETCNRRDQSKRNPKGTAFKTFMALYNGYRDKNDTEKAIYRLSTLGIIDDYTVNFTSNTFTLRGTKKTAKEYRENLRGYLLKYYSEKTTKAKLKNLDAIDEPTPIRKAINFLVNFVYDEIEKKRQRAISDMKDACRFGLENGNIELKEFIDLYFNSKYARKGYQVNNKTASLFDLLVGEEKKDDNIEYVWYFMYIMDIDKPSSQIDNYKHLRGACTRLLRSQPDSYTLILLNAFALYMIEYKNPRYLQEAEDLLMNAFTSIQEKESKWTDKKLEEIFNAFTEKIIDKNSEVLSFMEMHGFQFDFDSIMIKRLLYPLQRANSTLHEINKILN